MTLDSTDLALYTSLGLLNILFSSLVALTFLSSRELRQHPSGLIFSLSICELVMSYHSIIFVWDDMSFIQRFRLEPSILIISGYSIDQDSAKKVLCGMNQVLLTIGIVACLCYNIAICLDLVVTLYNPFISGHKRKKFYHSVTFLIVLYYTIYVNTENKFLSQCTARPQFRLEIANSGAIGILLTVFFTIGVFSAIYAAWRFARGLRIVTEHNTQYLIRHILYVIGFVVLWVWPTISYVMKINDQQSETVDTIAIATYCSSGFFLGLIRTSDPIFWKKAKECSFFRIQEIESAASDDAWNLPISVIVFGKLNVELAHCIIASLHGVFLTKKINSGSYQSFDTKDFTEIKIHKLSHYVRESANIWGITDSKFPHVEVEEVAPFVFEDIRNMCGMQLQDLLSSLEPSENKESMFKVDESAGKSGSFFLFTSDNRIAIKTIKSRERRIMKNILKHYHTHLMKYQDSMLCRILGLFTLRVPGVSTLEIILMENILYNANPSRVFDIKGSTVGRTAYKNGKVHGPYKDLDFIKMSQTLDLSQDDKDRMKAAILVDVNFLYLHKLMDYSLLLSISKYTEGKSYKQYSSIDQKYTYTMGIIDFLTVYSYWKSMEHTFNAIAFGNKVKHVSVANPKNYANRFVNFIFSIIVPIMRRHSSFSVDWNYVSTL